MTPYAADPSGGCGVSSCDRGREHGSGAPRLPALRFVRTASGSARPRPRLQRHAPRLGGFIRYRGVPRSPRGHKNPRSSRLAVCSLNLHRIRCGSLCLRRGVCPQDIAVTAMRHCAPFQAPTSASADHAAGGSSMGGGTLPRRHESRTDDLLSNPLAAIGPKAASAACHYPFRPNPPPSAGRAVTGGTRAAPPRSPLRLNDARGASRGPRPSHRRALARRRGTRAPRRRARRRRWR